MRVPNDVWFKISAGTAFEKTGGKVGEELTGSMMPIDPSDARIIYLSTYKILDPKFERAENRIYAYNLDTSTLTELFMETAERNSPFGSPSARILRLAGVSGSRLVVLPDDPASSPGPCADMVLSLSDSILSLDTHADTAALQPFTFSADDIAQRRMQQEQCEQEWSS